MEQTRGSSFSRAVLWVREFEAHGDGQIVSIDPFKRRNFALRFVNPESSIIIAKPLSGFDNLRNTSEGLVFFRSLQTANPACVQRTGPTSHV
jgi:hypothetical protein